MSPGELFAIGCALCWSLAVILFKVVGGSVPAVSLNLFKNLLGLALFIPTLWLLEGALFLPTSGLQLAILIGSGVLGIGIADALALRSLALIGATRWAVVECLYSPCVILISLVCFDERLGPVQIAGAALVLSAVLCVSSARGEPGCPPAQLVRGVLLGALSIVTMAVGILSVKPLFAELSLIWIITVRVAGGVLGSLLIVAFNGGIRRSLGHMALAERKGLMIAGSVLSTYVAMVLWVAGYKYNEAAVAAVLNQTATIFIVILAIVFLRERLTWRKLLGAVLSLAGVVAITLGK